MVLSDLPSAYTFQNGGRKDAGKTWTSRETQAISTGGGAGSDGAADHSAGGQSAPGLCGQNVPAGASLKQAKPGQILCFPLETAAWRVSDPYGWRKDPFTGEKAFHRGVDLACGEGTPVLAALDGVVTAARRGAAYGNYVRLTHGDGQETLYAHMQYLYVRAGEVVAAGQRLGTAGQTGRATGAHLHFEFLTGGIRYDPSAALSLP